MDREGRKKDKNQRKNGGEKPKSGFEKCLKEKKQRLFRLRVGVPSSRCIL